MLMSLTPFKTLTDVGRGVMPRVPAIRPYSVAEAIDRLERLQQELTRLAARDENYEGNQMALQAVIHDLRKRIPTRVQVERGKVA